LTVNYIDELVYPCLCEQLPSKAVLMRKVNDYGPEALTIFEARRLKQLITREQIKERNIVEATAK
jgi:hypothetical protein